MVSKNNALSKKNKPDFNSYIYMMYMQFSRLNR
jgi:hypothetical protein